MKIREKRREDFNNRCITPEIIRELATIIQDEVNSLSEKESENVYIVYSVDIIDDASYESQSKEIYEASIIKSRAMKKVVMRFNTASNSKNIEVQIVHSVENDQSDNFILVSGDDSNWVNGILARIHKVISSAQPQPKYFDQFVALFFWGFIFIPNIVYFRLCYKWIQNLENDLIRIFFLIGAPILLFVASGKISEYIKGLYPSIELQTGPEYLQIPKRKRRIISLLLVVIICPIIIDIIVEVFLSHYK